MAMARPMKADDLGIMICEAMELPVELCHRIIIDLQTNAVVQVYVQFHGSTKLLELDWENALKDAEVIKVE
jgi:hypothetical protein